MEASDQHKEFPMADITPIFDQSLLTKSIQERVKAFQQEVILHRKMADVLYELTSLVTPPVAPWMVFMSGPSGVGKTTVLNVLEDELVEYFSQFQQIPREPKTIPVVRIESDPLNGLFSRNSYARILEKLGQPFADAITKRSRTDELRHRMYQALEEQNTRVLIIDSAQDANLHAREKRLEQLNHLKDLSERGIKIVLSETHEPLLPREQSVQIVRQIIKVDFSRYQDDIPEDLDDFQGILKEFQRRLPVQDMPDFTSYFDYLYSHSVGCVGILHSWLTRALSRSLNEGSTTITLKHLEQTTLDSSICNDLLNNAKVLEKSFFTRQVTLDKNNF